MQNYTTNNNNNYIYYDNAIAVCGETVHIATSSILYIVQCNNDRWLWDNRQVTWSTACDFICWWWLCLLYSGILFCLNHTCMHVNGFTSLKKDNLDRLPENPRNQARNQEIKLETWNIIRYFDGVGPSTLRYKPYASQIMSFWLCKVGFYGIILLFCIKGPTLQTTSIILLTGDLVYKIIPP